MTLTVGSLFSGIAGFDLAFERAGCRTVAVPVAEWLARRIVAAEGGGS